MTINTQTDREAFEAWKADYIRNHPSGASNWHPTLFDVWQAAREHSALPDDAVEILIDGYNTPESNNGLWMASRQRMEAALQALKAHMEGR